jgi:parallel beta-helix repeat protein
MQKIFQINYWLTYNCRATQPISKSIHNLKGLPMKRIVLCLSLAFTLICSCNSIAQTIIPSSTTFPYTISVPGSYKLGGNLKVTATGINAINVTAPNVTIDLGGYTISGPLVCTSVSCSSGSASSGISSNGYIVIQNGFVSGFTYCLTGVTALIQNMGVSSCGDGIYFSSTVPATTTLVRNSVTNCASFGIYATNAVITENNVSGNKYGIYALNSTLFNNEIMGSTYGLVLSGGLYSGNMIMSNTTDVTVGTGATTLSPKNNACTNGAC